MSVFWNRKTYKAYRYTVGTKWKPFQKRSWKYYPCPGCMSHREVIGAERGRRVFLKYVNYPQKACALYWKTHQAEYRAMLEENDKLYKK